MYELMLLGLGTSQQGEHQGSYYHEAIHNPDGTSTIKLRYPITVYGRDSQEVSGWVKNIDEIEQMRHFKHIRKLLRSDTSTLPFNYSTYDCLSAWSMQDGDTGSVFRRMDNEISHNPNDVLDKGELLGWVDYLHHGLVAYLCDIDDDRNQHCYQEMPFCRLGFFPVGQQRPAIDEQLTYTTSADTPYLPQTPILKQPTYLNVMHPQPSKYKAGHMNLYDYRLTQREKIVAKDTKHEGNHRGFILGLAQDYRGSDIQLVDAFNKLRDTNIHPLIKDIIVKRLDAFGLLPKAPLTQTTLTQFRCPEVLIFAMNRFGVSENMATLGHRPFAIAMRNRLQSYGGIVNYPLFTDLAPNQPQVKRERTFFAADGGGR